MCKVCGWGAVSIAVIAKHCAYFIHETANMGFPPFYLNLRTNL